MVKIIILMQEEPTLKRINFLTADNPIEFLGRTIKCLDATMSFSQQFIEELLNIFEVTGKVTTTGLKHQAVPENQKAECDKALHPKFRAATGKLFRMAQLRDHLISKFGSFAPVCQPEKALSLCHGTSAPCHKSTRQAPKSGCQLFRFRLGKLSKKHGSQQVVHWFQFSMPIFNQPAEFKLQLLIHQLLYHMNKATVHHWQSRASFRSSAQAFFPQKSALLFS